MSAARRRGVVMRGGAACQWDGERYVRLFAARRGLHGAVIESAVRTMGEPLFGEPVSGMDAPDLLPAGAMRNSLDGVCFGVPVVVFREASK